MQYRSKLSIVALLIGIAALTSVIIALKTLKSSYISEATCLQVQEGMTRTEVVDVAGSPHKISENGALWLYNVWGFSNMLHVVFSDDGKAESVSF